MASGGIGSLPHRQLRKVYANPVASVPGSLPHRQLRNITVHNAKTRSAFTAAQAA